MLASRLSAPVITLLLGIALVSGGLIHAVVPHAHGDGHNHGQTKESSIWASLHNGLSHEQKNFLAVAVAFIAASLGILTAVPYLLATTHAVPLALARARDPNSGEPLRRGILPHRKFK